MDIGRFLSLNSSHAIVSRSWTILTGQEATVLLHHLQLVLQQTILQAVVLVTICTLKHPTKNREKWQES